MACEENPFALLGDDEGDDISTLLARVAMKTDASSAAAEKQQEQKEENWHSKFPSRRLPRADYVRAENGRGTGGQGRDLRRSSFNDIQQFGNGYSNGYQRNNRGSNGHRQNNGGADGYRRDGRRADGYRRNGGGFDGHHRSCGTGGKDDGSRQGLGRRREGAKGRSDSGQGKALNEDNGFETVSQFAEDNQQFNTLEQGENTDDGWETVTGGHSFKNKQQPRNWNSRFGGGRRGNGHGGGFRARGGCSFGASDGRNYGSGEVMNNSATKEAGLGGDHDVNGNYGTGNVDAITEVSEGPSQDYSREEAAQDEETKEAIWKAKEEGRGKAQEREQKQKEWEARRKAQEEEAKKMTLEQYQKLLLEKRKALESLKTEERKVILDRDFESMQLGGKKKEDSLFIKQDSKKGKLKNKDEKSRKVSIAEFLKPAVGGQGQGLGGYRRGSSSRQAAVVPANGNFGRNELLKRNVDQVQVEHSDRCGGGSGRNRGSRGADSTNRDDDDEQYHEEIVKPVLAIGDTSQFPDLGGV